MGGGKGEGESQQLSNKLISQSGSAPLHVTLSYDNYLDIMPIIKDLLPLACCLFVLISSGQPVESSAIQFRFDVDADWPSIEISTQWDT